MAASLSASAAPPSYRAHEWGTFTSIQGADGAPIAWNPFTRSDLPSFVYSRQRPMPPAVIAKNPLGFSLLGGKDGRAWRQRMETPVIYFHADEPLTVRGSRARHICAFRRVWRSHEILVIVPRLVLRLTHGRGLPTGAVWGNTSVDWESSGPRRFRNLFTDELLVPERGHRTPERDPSRANRPNASRRSSSIPAKWYVIDPSGTSAAAAMRRWDVPATPCSATTSRHAATMRSRRSGS